MVADVYSLKSPTAPEEWQQYHDIRRRVLWENRGRFGVYDETHPDEHKDDHFPLLLTLESEAVGVIRIDIEGERAIFRRVAVREDSQRLGHGTNLMKLAENFARDRGCKRLYSYVDPEAVRFYEKRGFERDLNSSAVEAHVAMEKWL